MAKKQRILWTTPSHSPDLVVYFCNKFHSLNLEYEIVPLFHMSNRDDYGDDGEDRFNELALQYKEQILDRLVSGTVPIFAPSLFTSRIYEWDTVESLIDEEILLRRLRGALPPSVELVGERKTCINCEPRRAPLTGIINTSFSVEFFASLQSLVAKYAGSGLGRYQWDYALPGWTSVARSIYKILLLFGNLPILEEQTYYTRTTEALLQYFYNLGMPQDLIKGLYIAAEPSKHTQGNGALVPYFPEDAFNMYPDDEKLFLYFTGSGDEWEDAMMRYLGCGTVQVAPPTIVTPPRTTPPRTTPTKTPTVRTPTLRRVGPSKPLPTRSRRVRFTE